MFYCYFKGLHDLKDFVVTRADVGIQFNYLIPSTGKNIMYTYHMLYNPQII